MRVDRFRFRPSRRADRAEAGAAARQRAAAARRGRRRSPIIRCSILPDLLRPGDVLVFNDTKVIPAQLEGRRGEASIGATLHKREGPREWQAFLRNAKRARVGDMIDFGAGVAASVVEKVEDGSALLHFHGEEPVELLLERAGRMPLPPYIASQRASRRGGPRRLSDHVRARGGRGRGADGGASLHAAAARSARRARHRPRDADPARRRGDVPAGQGGGHRRPQDACRMGPDRCSDGRAAERRARIGRAADRGRHDEPAPARKRRGRGRDRSARSKATPRSSSRPAIASRRSTA